MTRTDARLAAVQRQRRFEWELARDEQARVAARLVAGKTHDLLNLVQIVQLATFELEKQGDPAMREFLDDLSRAAAEAQTTLAELMAAAHPEPPPGPGAPVGAAVGAAVAAVAAVVTLDLHLETAPTTRTRCTARELEHLVIGLVLDVADAPGPIELTVREREIAGKPWVELVRSSAFVPADRGELRTVEVIAVRAGGELATSDRRGGGEEIVVALPVAR